MDSRKIGRRSARKRAFQFVYAMNFQVFADQAAVEKAFYDLPEEEEFEAEAMAVDQSKARRTEEDRAFGLRLAKGVRLWREEIDGLIQRFSKHWRVARIAKAELSVLRLAIYEMLHEPDIPLRVSINEAVELSKAFGDEQSFPFVNGILDAVAKAVRDGQLGIHKEF